MTFTFRPDAIQELMDHLDDRPQEVDHGDYSG
jgi:hypothetical protein